MSGILIVLLLAAGIGIFIASSRDPETRDLGKLVEMIDSLLPQTQCEKCGYAGCRPYAEAITRNEADINQCPPGGARVIKELSAVLNRPVVPLNPAHGVEGLRHIARIREEDCIGCTKCIQACPTDAIIGTGKMMHTVIAADCTGCGLCMEPCPTDCIELYPAPEALQPEQMPSEDRRQQSNRFRHKYEMRQHRLNHMSISAENSTLDKQHFIQQALARVQAKGRPHETKH